MQRYSAAHTYIIIALDCLQVPALLLLATNKMQGTNLQGAVSVWSALHAVHCVQDRV